jgi:hypothetical protein
MRTRVIAVVAAFSVLFSAGIAAASSDGGDARGDTRFSFGYDPQAQLFFSSIQDIESSTLDCSLSGSLTATYGEATEDGATPVTGLMAGEEGKLEEVTFGPSEGDGTDGAEAAGDPIGYSLAIDECGIAGYPVGTNGHINHGQFMKLFNELVDMKGRGCLNRWLAGSSLGKDDQQVKGGDETDTVEAIAEGGTIDFISVLASCDHGNKDKAVEVHPGNGHKKDDAATADGDDTDDGHGRPDSPGKSDQAKGKKKDK